MSPRRAMKTPGPDRRPRTRNADLVPLEQVATWEAPRRQPGKRPDRHV
ncbi:hypothetical protein CLV77_2112 [Brevirhabdus pacifica]|nr:hypothetical protein CLV77_2112 [Brevirhabdus pacifica]